MEKEIIFSYDDGPMDGMSAVEDVLKSLGIEYEVFEPTDESYGIRYKIPENS